MERKTKINAEDGQQSITIIREFDLPVDLLFRAHAEAEILEEWMGTKVLKLETKKFGAYQLETTDPHGNKFRFNGVFHEFEPNKKITRTFEFENTPFGVQLEYIEFENVTAETSKLVIHSVFRSVEHRNELLKLPFASGLNSAHNKLETVARKLL